MNAEHENQDVEFEAFLRQFRPRKPHALGLQRRRAIVALAAAAAIVLAAAASLRLAWPASEETAGTTANANRPQPDVARQSRPSRTLDLIPFVEATLSASAPAAGQPRVNVSLPATPRRKALRRITPSYPPEAEEIGLAGEVVLKVTVNSAGDVTRTDRVSSTVDLWPDDVGGRERIEFFAQHPYAFAQAAEAAAKEWTFEPARTSMTVFVAFLFTLKSPEEAAKAAASTAGAALPQGAALARPGPPPAASQSGPLRVGGAIKPPTRLVNVNPDYPEDAKAAAVQGVVILQIIVGEDGTVTDARVVRSIPELDQAALDAVRQWQYEPTLLNGVPVEVELTVTINFTLK